MSTSKKKTIKFTALMTVLILTVAYFSLLTPTSAYFYQEFNFENDGITFSLLEVNDGERIFDEEVTLKFKGATKFADYGEKLFDEVAEVREFTVTNTGVDARILPRITLHNDSEKYGLKYMIVTSDPYVAGPEAVSEESSDSESVESETITKGELKKEIESRLNLFTEKTTQEGETTEVPSIGYSDAVSALNSNNEIKSVKLTSGESVDVKIIFWAEYTDIVNEKGESAWQNAGIVETIPYQCTIEIIASQDNNEAVTEALKEVPAWKTTAESQ